MEFFLLYIQNEGSYRGWKTIDFRLGINLICAVCSVGGVVVLLYYLKLLYIAYTRYPKLKTRIDLTEYYLYSNLKTKEGHK